MHKIKLNKTVLRSTALALLGLCVFTSLAQGQAQNLEIFNITPPISPSQYSTSYEEYGDNQIQGAVKHKGAMRTYQLYAPSGYSRTPQQAIILLHGAKRSGVSMIDKWERLADRNDVILIAPNAVDGIWQKSDNVDFFNKILVQVDKGYKVDRSRLYLFGHSLGGHLALYLARKHPTYFASAAVHAGAMNKAHMSGLTLSKRKVPIAFFNGTHDKAVPLDTVRKTATRFAENNHDTKLYILEGHNHWYYDIADFINSEAWQFLEAYHQ